jgi:N-methylhydantoinase A/oxoprolinase/acetone carboxylase beta subunit
MRLDLEAASQAIHRTVATPLNIPLEPAAEGIIAIVNANMANAIRLSLSEKGLDPADFALLAFGGAGGLHAAALAEECGMKQMIFPHSASTFSAFGMLWTDIVHHAARSRVLLAVPPHLPSLRTSLNELLREADDLLTSDKVDPTSREISVAADMRYLGQGYELTVPWPETALDEASLAAVVRRFHELHQQRFLHADVNGAVEFVTLRVIARGRLPFPRQLNRAPTGAKMESRTGTRRIYLAGEFHEVPVWHRAQLRPTELVIGPAIIEEDYTTILLPINWKATVTDGGHVLANLERT